ncbi:hypothetical protein [uncultured Tenacibaculum sp.]|uniref:hypothetical protein n=1 Tax=uncultured Tenacibaculum sp. TaxID=174713 RepID=UPI00260B9D3F|nr:hypothetical protein [uncultured Tenacibaculum sp.]
MSKLNLKGNININDSESYQFLYASQCYQTLYSVYGKFNGAERIQEKGDDFLNIKVLDLYLVNYQGTINIGFHDGGFRSELKMRKNPTNQTIEPLIPLELDEKEKEIDKHSIHDIVHFPSDETPFFELRGLCGCNRKRYRNLKICLNKNKELNLFRNIKRLNEGNRSNTFNNNMVFDNEYFSRDGIDTNPLQRVSRRGVGATKMITDEYGNKLISGNCIETILNIIP